MKLKKEFAALLKRSQDAREKAKNPKPKKAQ